jgi:nucleoside phosphorylase
MNILFVSALSVELHHVKKKIDKVKSFLKEKKSKLKISFLLSWVGNYNTIFELQKYLQTNEVDFIVNIGVCWFSNVASEVPNIGQVYRIKNLASGKESLVPVYFEFAPYISLASSEKTITLDEQMGDELFVDMESYGVDYVATKMKIPVLILKVPFDRVSTESQNVKITDIEQKLDFVDYKDMLLRIEEYLMKNVSKGVSLQKYINELNPTFSEREILKREYHRFQAFDKDFQLFFQENKLLPKKEFFKKLQQYN